MGGELPYAMWGRAEGSGRNSGIGILLQNFSFVIRSNSRPRNAQTLDFDTLATRIWAIKVDGDNHRRKTRSRNDAA